jgi:hypothetical protein
VDKNIALLLQYLSGDFNTSREDVKPSLAQQIIFLISNERQPGSSGELGWP